MLLQFDPRRLFTRPRRSANRPRRKGLHGTSDIRRAVEHLEERALLAADGGITIGDFVWADLNGNGAQDIGEPGIENATVNLLDEFGSFLNSTTTDATGAYCFPDLEPANYIAEFVRPAGFDFTSQNAGLDEEFDSDANPADGRVPVSLLSGGSDLDIDAGFRRASIGDFVWNDLNGDGVRDDGEPGLEGVTVFLDRNSSGTLDDGEPADTTDADGSYEITGLTDGEYDLNVLTATLPADFHLTTNNVPLSVTLAPGEDFDDGDFGYQEATPVNQSRGEIQVRKFHDRNADGLAGLRDSWLNGVTIELKDTGGLVIDTAVTADVDLDGNGTIDPATESGWARFDGLPAGDYVVSEVISVGWRTSTPGDFQVTLAQDQISGGVYFGNYQPGRIEGRKWHDRNANTRHEPGEEFLNGWMIQIVRSSGAVAATYTTGDVDLNGDNLIDVNTETGWYIVDDLTPDTYTVREIQQPGFRQTWPHFLTLGGAITEYTVTLESGQVLRNNDFGNVQTARVHGRKYNDRNANGLRDIDEDYVNGRVVRLTDLLSNVVWEATTTDLMLEEDGELQPGAFVFDVIPGVYLLDCGSQEGAVAPEPMLLEVQAGENVDVGGIPLIHGVEVNGYKWHDRNGNGVRDPGEPGLAGWEIQVFDSAGTLLQSTITLTDDPETDDLVETGMYRFQGLPAGTLTLREVPQEGWTQTFPMTGGNAELLFQLDTQREFKTPTRYFQNYGGQDERWVETANGEWHFILPNGDLFEWDRQRFAATGTLVASLGGDVWHNPGLLTDARRPLVHEVTVAAGQIIEDIDFGNARLPAFHGRKFHDRNADGQRDSDEEYLNGWTIQVVDAAGNVVASDTTHDHDEDDDGVINPDTERGWYWITVPADGTYTLREVPRTGWEQTAPGPDAVLQLAWELDQTLDLSTTGSLFEDWGGRGEKWFIGHSDGFRWYFIEPDGRVFEWEPGSPRHNISGTLVATLDERIHAEPHLLYNAEQPQPGSATYTVGPGETAVVDFGNRTRMDFGDAPEGLLNTVRPLNYPTKFTRDGARHAAQGALLGERRDVDADGQPDFVAAGDDNDADGNDDDGITFIEQLIIGQETKVDVEATGAGHLSAWIDLDLNGDWTNDEQVITDHPVVAGTQIVRLALPDTVQSVRSKPGATYMRFRLTSGTGLGPKGFAPDGEVEDYLVRTLAARGEDDTVWGGNGEDPVNVDVLANDTPDGVASNVTGIVAQGEFGTAEVNEDGTVTYTPGPNFNGADSFSYGLNPAPVALGPADGRAGDRFGAAADIFGDLAIVGAPGDGDRGDDAGAAYILERVDGVWTELKKLAPIGAELDAGDRFGSSVAIFGNTAVVGSWGDGQAGPESGSVYLFQRDLGGIDNWGLKKTMTAPDGAALDRFGFTVDINADVLAVGAPGDDIQGAVYLFQRDLGGSMNWGFRQRMTGDVLSVDSAFATAIALNGQMLAVGAPGNDSGANNSGSVFLFGPDPGNPGHWQQKQNIANPDPHADDAFGSAVAFSSSATGLLIGTPADDEAGADAGAVHLFGRDDPQVGSGNDLFSFLQKLTPANSPDQTDGPIGDGFGGAVGMNGNVFLVGAPETSAGDGHVYIFGRDDNDPDVWVEQEQVGAPHPGEGEGWGTAVPIHLHDSLLTSPFGNGLNPEGEIHYVVPELLVKTPPILVEVSFVPPLAVPDFVTVQGGFAFQGSIEPGHNDLPIDQVVALNASPIGPPIVKGKFNLRNLTTANGTFTYEATADAEGVARFAYTAFLKSIGLESADKGANDRFGSSVEMDGRNAIVGAPFDDRPALGGISAAADVGSVQIFEFRNGVWRQTVRIQPGDLPATALFGASVAISQDIAVVGAPFDNGRSGSVYMFRRDEGGANNWGLVKKFVEPANLKTTSALFGASVDIDMATRRLYVGAPHDDASKVNGGAVYVFDRDHQGTGAWGMTAKLTGQNAGIGDEFGRDISASGALLAIGVPKSDLGAKDSGIAEVWKIDANQFSWTRLQQFRNPTAHAGDNFGQSVGIAAHINVTNGYTESGLVVGAPRDDADGTDAGTAHAWELSGGATTFSYKAELEPARSVDGIDGRAGDLYGTSVDVMIPHPSAIIQVIVGAPWTNHTGKRSGSAYAYVAGLGSRDTLALVGTMLSHPDNKTLVDDVSVPSDILAGDLYGTSVAVGNPTATPGYLSYLMGAPGDDNLGTNVGSVRRVYPLIGLGEFTIEILPPQPLLAESAPAHTSATPSLKVEELRPVADAAILRFADAGATAGQVERLRNLDLVVADLSGARLGEATSLSVTFDVNAAEFGWYIDEFPFDDAEFSATADGLRLESDNDNQGRMDLLTVVMHEFGHVLGLGHDHDESSTRDLMHGTLQAGQRRLPPAIDWSELDDAFGESGLIDALLSH